MEGPDPAQLVGAVVAGRYRVQALLGTGGMSAVYEVEDQHAGGRVAMKVLLPPLGEDPVNVARFTREAKAMGLFEHRNIIALRDHGRLDTDAPFLVMDLVRGASLREVLEEGPLDPVRALSIIRQVLEALSHAHAIGVVHRDIKPENIMLVDGGSPHEDAELVKVLDFGIAKIVGDARALLGEATLTQAGYAQGSPRYVAPEALLGHILDARADLYAVGVVLFELLTGRSPFNDEDPVALARLHVTAPIPSLTQTAPERSFTPQVEYLVGEALAKKPEHRFGSAAEMLGALDAANRSLEAILGGGTIQSLVPPLAALAPARRAI
ncbi:MAG TPA: serine/threonine-protein kinase, partial [Kofleriaceae bacterium]|nr:serine/threonine-protein kinase [Kofleriaceae bacterium]